MKGKRKLNKYEKEVMQGLYFITGIFCVVVVANLITPIFTPVKFGYATLFTYIAIIVHAYGVFEAWGYGNQSIPIAQIILTRFAEFCFYFFISKYNINFLMFIVIIGLDAMLLLLEFLDRSKYEYVREREE